MRAKPDRNRRYQQGEVPNRRKRRPRATLPGVRDFDGEEPLELFRDDAEELGGFFFLSGLNDGCEFFGEVGIFELEEASVIGEGEFFFTHREVEDPTIHVGLGEFFIQFDCEVVVQEGFPVKVGTLFAKNKSEVVMGRRIFRIGLDGGPKVFFGSGILFSEELPGPLGEEFGVGRFGGCLGFRGRRD